MPAEASSEQVRQRSILRFALCAFLATLVGQTVGLELTPLGYILPVLALMTVGPGSRPIPLFGGLLFVVQAALLLGASMALYYALNPHPAVYLIAILLTQLLTYYAMFGGLPILLVAMPLLGNCIFPLVGQGFSAPVHIVGQGLLTDLVLAIVVQRAVFAFLPLLPGEGAAKEKKPTPSAEVRFWAAVRSTSLVAPLLVGSVVFQWGTTLSLIFAVLFATQSNLKGGLKMGAGMALANIYGGVAAVVAAAVLFVVPAFPLLLSVLTFMALRFGAKLNSGKPTAPLYGTAFNAVLVLIGASFPPAGEDWALGMLLRVGQIVLAVVYVVIAFTVLYAFRRPAPAPVPALESA